MKFLLQQEGKLYLFLGYADGVGKTHMMLNTALQQQQQGLNVEIVHVKQFANAGYLEMIEKFEHVPSQQHGFAFIDVEAILQRKPHVVILDDLYQCNQSQRCYQALHQILDAGIHVYTTLTVYYLQSLSDTVERLTGMQFEKPVPDSLLDQAAHIQLVDAPVETVLQRVQNKTVLALESPHSRHIFSEATLTAFRQMALRYVSQWIESHPPLQAASLQQLETLNTVERLMVCISASPLSSKLIRAAHQLARELDAEWVVVYVESSQGIHDEHSQNRLIQNMHLAENLGGKVVTIHGETIADTLMRYAKRHDITKMIIGYPTRSLWHSLWHESVIDSLIKHNSDMDIYIISSSQPEENFVDFVSEHGPLQWQKYLLAFGVITATTLLDIFIRPFVFPATLVTLYLLGIAAVAVYLGNRSAMIATILSVVSFFFFFVPSSVDTPIETMPYIVILVGLLFAGTVLTRFITGALERADSAYRRADQMMELYSLSRDLSTTIAPDDIIGTITTHVHQTFQAEVGLYLNQDDGLELHQATAGFPTSSDSMIMLKAYETGQSTGAGTPAYTEATAIYVPMRTAHKKVGVLGVAFPDGGTPTLDQHRLLDAFANQAALAMEASRLMEETHRARLAQEREKLQSALLDSISHDIRTPLVAITGALSSLRDEETLFDAQMRVELIDDAWLETERLNRLVENLLEMSRLQSGELRLNCDWHDLDEIIAVARSQLRERLRDYQIRIHLLQEDVSLVYVDFTLMVQVLVNLLDNAAKYTTDVKIIEICTMCAASSIILQVADRGPGIPKNELPLIFNKFYRASNVRNINGTGLGLSICAGIVEAHNGSIYAFNRPEGGAVFEVRLPMENSHQ